MFEVIENAEQRQVDVRSAKQCGRQNSAGGETVRAAKKCGGEEMRAAKKAKKWE